METLVLQGEPKNVERVWLLSIRHSGTHYMYPHLKILGYDQCVVFWDKMKQRHPTRPKQFLHAHVEIGYEYAKYLTDEKVVMPLRNPVEVFRTHVYRYAWPKEQFEPYILDAFIRYEAAHGKYNVWRFQVDAPDQKTEVYRLANWLGAVSWTYKQQDRNIGTSKAKECKEENGFEKYRAELYADPPQSILELASQYGY